ncbi:MAG: DUF5723 family protein [Bacteroidota bacterium]
MRIISVFFMAFGLSVAMAQNKQILYGLEEVPQSLMINPGVEVPQKAHFGIPFLSQIHINGGATGVSTFDIFGNSGGDINTRIRNKIFEMDANDFFTATQQLEILNFGWRSEKEIYFSGGIYQELDFVVYFPRDLAILAWEGNRDYLDYKFDLGEVSATADLMTVYHFGANKQINKKWTVGARAKIYSSILSAKSTNNEGSFVTSLSEDGPNIYEHRIENADVKVQTSGITSLENSSVGKVLSRAFFGGNVGLGVDLGATYKINDSWTASASVLDVGVIFHSKDVEQYHGTGSYTLNGIELIFPPLSEGESTIPYYDNLEDEIEREVPIDTINSGYSQWRPVKANAGVTYSFGRFLGGEECDCLNQGLEREQAIGLQYYSIIRPKGPQMAATLFYERRLWDFLQAKATYTVDPYSFYNIGLGAAADLGKFNFYVAADNILHYGNIAKAKSVSLQLGFNIKIDQEL